MQYVLCYGAQCSTRCAVCAVLQASVREQKKLLVENGKLKKDIEGLRVQLQEKQRRRVGKETQLTQQKDLLQICPFIFFMCVYIIIYFNRIG